MTVGAAKSFDLRPGRPDELDLLVALDDAAGVRFAEAGITFAVSPAHPFVVAERARWRDALRDERAFVADVGGRSVGFLVLGIVDGNPYLDQLCVVPELHGRGHGGAMIDHAKAWATARGSYELWLTTYAHVVWNGPYYARRGFVRIDDDACGPGTRSLLDDQRAVLPFPRERIAMRWVVG